MIQIAFYVLAVMLIIAALGVVMFKNPIYSLLSLIAVFFTLTSHYVLLQASFVGILNIIVYAGAMMVLFLFVIMFLNLNQGLRHSARGIVRKILGVILPGLLVLFLTCILKHNHEATIHASDLSHVGSVKALARVLIQDYKYLLLLIAVLLLMTTIGAVLLSTKHTSSKPIRISNNDPDTI